MNSTAQYIINKHFTRNEVKCGIGIDTGKMLVTKTGFRRRGVEQRNYKNLVWLGRPANVASKLTDIDNKPRDGLQCDKVRVAYQDILSTDLYWRNEWPNEFAKNVSHTILGGMHHSNANYRSHHMTSEYGETRAATDPILMTDPVYKGLKAAHPTVDYVKAGWFKKVVVEVPGYTGDVYGGDVTFNAFSK